MVKKSATLGMDNMLLFVTDSVFNCANAIEISYMFLKINL